MSAGTYHATAVGHRPSSPSSCARPWRSACVTAHVDGGSPSRTGLGWGALAMRAPLMTQHSELLPSGRGIPARRPARGYVTSCRGPDAGLATRPRRGSVAVIPPASHGMRERRHSCGRGRRSPPGSRNWPPLCSLVPPDRDSHLIKPSSVPTRKVPVRTFDSICTRPFVQRPTLQAVNSFLFFCNDFFFPFFFFLIWYEKSRNASLSTNHDAPVASSSPIVKALSELLVFFTLFFFFFLHD